MLSRLLESEVLTLRESDEDTTVAESFVLESVLFRISIVLFIVVFLSFVSECSVLYSIGDFGRAKVTGTPGILMFCFINFFIGNYENNKSRYIEILS